MTLNELREKDTQALEKLKLQSLEDQCKLRLVKGASTAVKPHELRKLRRTIARINTLLKERSEI